MEFSDEMIDFLSKSSAISLDDEERKQLKKDLHKIFDHIESLKHVPTDHVQACTHPLSHQCNVVRDDLVEPSMDRQLFLNNCPSHVAGMVRVPSVINKE